MSDYIYAFLIKTPIYFAYAPGGGPDFRGGLLKDPGILLDSGDAADSRTD